MAILGAPLAMCLNCAPALMVRVVIETNPLYFQITDLSERVLALRGYL